MALPLWRAVETGRTLPGDEMASIMTRCIRKIPSGNYLLTEISLTGLMLNDGTISISSSSAMNVSSCGEGDSNKAEGRAIVVRVPQRLGKD